MKHWRRTGWYFENIQEAEEKLKELKAQGLEVKMGACWIHHGRRCHPSKVRGRTILELK